LASVGSWDLHVAEDNIHCSAEVYRIFGLPNDAPLCFSGFLSHVHARDRQKVLEIDSLVRSSMAAIEVEYRIVRPDGEVRFVRSILEPIRNDGVLIRIAGSIQDITEQVTAREFQLENEQRLRTAERLAHIGSWRWDIGDNRVYWSEEIFRILGRPLNFTPSYEAFIQTVVPQDRERVTRWVRECLARRNQQAVEFQIALPENDQRTVRCIAEVSLDEDGLPAYMSGTCQDITESKQAEAAVRESERIYRAIGESIDFGVWVCTPDGRNTYKSESFLNTSGLTQEQCWDFRWADVLHPDDAERTVTAWKECVTTEGRWDMEYRFRGVDGRWHPVLSRGVPVRDEQGRISCWAGINLDISRLKQTEEWLRERESQARARAAELQAIMDAAPVAIFIAKDAECRHIEGNRTASALLRQQPDTDLGELARNYKREGMRVLRDGAEVPSGDLPIEIATRTGQPVRNYDLNMVFADGTSVTLLGDAVPMLGDDGSPRGAVTVLRDITERNKAEAALRESEERFRNMADTAPVMIWVAGPDKRFTFVNRTWLDFTGRTLEEELGDGWLAGMHPDERDYCYAKFCSTFDARGRVEIERRMRRADGEYRTVHCTGVPRYENGIFAGYIGSDVDITDIRRVQEEAFARQKLESMGVLAAGVAHDFNNLLGGILASVELVLEEQAEGRLTLRNGELTRIRTAAIRGAEIVRQLMTYAGEQSQTLEPIDLCGLVREMLELLKVSVSKNALLEADLPERLPAVEANAAQIRQVVMNLIINASEALGENEGVISVSVAQVQVSSDSAHLPQGDYIQLTIADTGEGMTPGIQSRIFDPFFTTKFAGRGLGLTFVQGIIRSHGGAINIASSPGSGSRFQVLLPCATQRKLTSTDISPAEPPVERRSGTGTVLLIEDEDALRDPVSRMLRRKAFTVIEAADGKTAVDLFRETPNIDAVVLDLTLPGMPGRDVFVELQKTRPGINVIITSAYSRQYALTAMGGQQSWLYIRKPYSLAELTEVLRSICPSNDAR
jgi:PAS domain S-box-containing protein